MNKLRMTSIASVAVMLLSLTGLAISPAGAAVDRTGKTCAQEGSVVSSNGVTYTCSKTTSGLVYSQGRKLSGSLTVVCGAMESWCAAMTKAFTKKTGVETKFVRLSSGETVARLNAAKANPEFGVWHGGPADGFGVARLDGLIEKYESPTRNMIPKKYQDTDGYWTGVYVGALGFCSNSKELKRLGVAVPKSWADLLNPKLKGQISSAHPSTSGTAFTTLWTQVTRLGGVEPGMAYMKKLHNNILQYTKSGTAPGQIAGRGEVAVGIIFSHDCVAYREQGLPLTVSFPSEGTGYEIGGVALIKGAKNPEAAKSYIDFVLSAEAQNLGPTVASYQVLTNPRAKLDRRMVTLKKLAIVDYDFGKAAAAKKALTTRFDAEIAVAPKV